MTLCAGTGFQPSLYVEGQLNALAYDRGFANRSWTVFQRNPREAGMAVALANYKG